MGILVSEQRTLFAKSGNRCAFRDCRRVLTADGSPPDRIVVLGEAAHIVAESPQGPRGRSPLTSSERNRYDNLVLLCNQHHQLIDAQPQTYTVAYLHAMKEEHERWVERTLGTMVEGLVVGTPAPLVEETVHSTLLPIERMPTYVYGVPCDVPYENQIQGRLRPLRGREMVPYILRGAMLFAFQNLNEQDGPFVELVEGQPVERFRVSEWIEDPNHFRWFIELLNRSLNKLTGRRGLMLDRDHRRYYFPIEKPGELREAAYTPLNKKRTSRKVVWEPKSKRTGEGRGYWFHRAIALRFLQIGTDHWCLSLRPELRITTDGINVPKSAFHNSLGLAGVHVITR